MRFVQHLLLTRRSMMRRSSGSRRAFTTLSTFTTTCWWGVPSSMKPATTASDVYLLGVLVMAGLLVHEHRIAGVSDASQLDLARIDRAFFRANIAVSFSIFACTLLDRVLPRVDVLRGVLS